MPTLEEAAPFLWLVPVLRSFFELLLSPPKKEVRRLSVTGVDVVFEVVVVSAAGLAVAGVPDVPWAVEAEPLVGAIVEAPTALVVLSLAGVAGAVVAKLSSLGGTVGELVV